MISPEDLAEIPLFDGMSYTEIEPFAALAMRKEWRAGERLLYAGNPAQFLFYIVSGEVTVKVYDDDRLPIMVSVLGPRAIGGWSALIPPHEATAALTAMTDVVVYAFEGEALREECAANPAAGLKLLLNVTRVINHRLDEARSRLASALQQRKEVRSRA